MDKVTFGSNSFVIVTKNDGLMLSTSSTAVSALPTQRNSLVARQTTDIPGQNVSWRPSDQRGIRTSGTQIKLVLAEQKESKPAAGTVNNETVLQLVPSNTSKPFCATPLTNSVTILPAGSTILPKNSLNAQAAGGRMITSTISQGSVKGNAQALTVIPVNVAKSPQKLPTGNNIMVSLVSKGSDLSTWNASTSTISSSTAKPASGTFSSPNKLVIQFNSNQLPLLQQPRPVVPNHQRLAGGQQLVPSSPFAAVPGNNTQYVQLLATPQFQMQATSSDKVQAMVLPAATTVTGFANNKTKSTITQSQSIMAKTNGSTQTSTTQRLILPATSHVQLNMAMAGTNLFQTVPSSVGPAVAYIAPAVNPQNYTFVQTSAVTQSSANHRPKSTEFHPSAALPSSHASGETSGRNSAARQLQWPSAESSGGPRPRKPCNCTKSQCLKLYCECFANGEFCNDCNCCNCYNNLDHEDERARAVKSCIERNPHAFHPKIGKGGSVRQHNKGCNCKRSGCLKNYCECYEAKILCSSLCRCVGCRNFEESADGQTLLQLADAAEVRVQQQTAAETKLSSQILGPPVRPPSSSGTGERLPYTFMTLEVADAVCQCLIADMEGSERERLQPSDEQKERRILLEFERCLKDIIEAASRTKPNTP